MDYGQIIVMGMVSGAGAAIGIGAYWAKSKIAGVPMDQKKMNPWMIGGIVGAFVLRAALNSGGKW